MASKDSGSSMDLCFGFNDIKFSDRVLKIEIEHADVIDVKTIHLSSIVLAAKSPFFSKLLSKGTHATLRIHSSEEVALMDVLRFMYCNKLPKSTTSTLLHVLMAADKFQVSSCMAYCTQLLSKLPMTGELAAQLFNLPSSVIKAKEVQHLVHAAKKYLLHHYKDFAMFEEELLKLPIAGIEVVLSNNYLRLTSEDVVYDFVLKWTRKHYPLIAKRRKILTTRLGSLIRFDYMNYKKLKEILSCNDFDHAYASKVVIDALFVKARCPALGTLPQSVAREYKYLSDKVLDKSHPHCVFYLELTKQKCESLLPSNHVSSGDIHLGGNRLYLFAKRCTKDSDDLPADSYGLFLGMHGNKSHSCSVVYQFFARSKPTEDFSPQRHKGTHKLTGGVDRDGYRNLFETSWSRFIAKDSIYFINGVLYLKVQIRINS